MNTIHLCFGRVRFCHICTSSSFVALCQGLGPQDPINRTPENTQLKELLPKFEKDKNGTQPTKVRALNCCNEFCSIIVAATVVTALDRFG